MKKRYALVGIGGRSRMYSRAIVRQFNDIAELVALCDKNKGRLELGIDWTEKEGCKAAGYTDDQFDRMVEETKPDVVIVTTVDGTHDQFICRAMELGCDVITEKPMTTDKDKCQRIVDTQQKTGRKCTVTFNYRYSPHRTQVKDLLMSGVIGNILSVDFHWLLDTRHGADYFRRWHRYKRNSGGLMVHKATHHFDLVNWWLSSVPETVYATGSRDFYTPQTAERYGLNQRGERCLDCPEGKNCSFYLGMKDYQGLKKLYLDNEHFDGYFRDQCVFGHDIDIEDNMHVNVRYKSGAMMSYSLHAFMPWEGYVISFNGSRGRLEHVCQETVYFSGDGSVPGEVMPEGTKIKIFPHFKRASEVDIWKAEGGHGGGDPLLLNDIFMPEKINDKYKRAADYRSGGWSILTGIAANQSMECKAPVYLKDIIYNLSEPDYPAMPSPADPIPAKHVEETMPDWIA